MFYITITYNNHGNPANVARTVIKGGFMSKTNEDAIRKNISANIEYLLESKHMTAAAFAEAVGINGPQMSRYRNGTLPSLTFVAAVREQFDIPIERFMFERLEEAEPLAPIPVARDMEYEGLYQIYYYDPTVYNGGQKFDETKALKSGLLLIHEDKRTPNLLKAMALMRMEKNMADRYMDAVLEQSRGSLKNILSYMKTLTTSNPTYYGQLDMSAQQLFLSLRYQYESRFDQASIVLHKPNGTSRQYIGGLGVMCSSSKGPLPAPCAQLILLSREKILASEEEIGTSLRIHKPDTKLYEAGNGLADLLMQLYEQGEGTEKRSEEQKRMLVRGYLDKAVNEAIEQNLFRTMEVKKQDDDYLYHFIKRNRKIAKQKSSGR